MKTKLPNYKLTGRRKAQQEIFHLIGKIYDRTYEMNQNEIQNLLIAQRIRSDVGQIMEILIGELGSEMVDPPLRKRRLLNE